jgi:hypothetical protein
MNSNTKKQTKLNEATTRQSSPSRDLYSRVNAFFEQNQRSFFIISMTLSVLMSILLFDVKVSLSGDDCDYIIGANNFWRHFTFPSAHGAVLYQIVLSPFVGIFGMNLTLLKSLSAIFIVASMALFYKGLRHSVPAAVLMPALLLVSICSYVFFYASYTYSEAFFMLMQGLFVYYFAKYFLWKDDAAYHLKTDWSKYLTLAALVLGVVLARPVGYGVLGAVFLFFAIRRRWKDLLYTFAAFIFILVLFSAFKSILWPGTGGTLNFDSVLAKDPYNPTLGMEDFPGFVKRFTYNSQIYLSGFLYQFMGLIPDAHSSIISIHTVRTLAVYSLYACSLAIVFKRNKTLLFIGLYVGVMNFVSFVALQSSWAQDRLIMIYYPFILLFLLGGICYLFQVKALKKGFVIYPLLLLVICFGTLSTTKDRVGQNLPVLQQNLLGDRLYGFTPDWVNFIKGSQWAAKNLRKDAVIVSRKVTMSKVYTGRDFIVTHTALTVPIDSLAALKDKKGDDRVILVADATNGVFTGEAVQNIVSHIRGATKFLLNGTESTGVCVYAIPNEWVNDMTASMADNKMAYTFDFDDFIEQCRRMESIRIYDPDKMLRYLEDSRIDYFLLPQLRVYPTTNTGQYINDVHRYREFISFKYPNRFRTIHVIGDQEPCEIVEFIR